MFSNRDINRLALHTTLHSLAWCLSGTFSAVFLYREGLSPAAILIAFAAIMIFRFCLRPIVLVVGPRLGMRRMLMLGTAIFAIQYPLLAWVHGVDAALLAYCVIAAIGDVFYWTSYHPLFSALGDVEQRGSQIGLRQALGAVAGVVGPALGGVPLMSFGPWVAFLAAFAVEVVAVLPLLRIDEPHVAAITPDGAYAAARRGVRIFVTDGWIISASGAAWAIVMFEALGTRYDAYGGALALSALAGAAGGMWLGRYIDRGQARRATWLNAAILAGSLLLKAVCGADAVSVILVAIVTTVLGGIYVPALMTAVANEAKHSPCVFRFHFAAEGGWDAGGAAAALAAAGLWWLGVPLQLTILLALPMVAVQAWLLDASYRGARNAPRLAGDTALDPSP